MLSLAVVPSAINLASDELTDDMIVYVAVGGPRAAQTTLGNLRTFFTRITLVTKTENYAVTEDDSGTHFNNNGAAGSVVFSLPAAVVGLLYTFVVVTAQTVSIEADGADLLKSDVFSASTISGAVQYSAITIECHATGIWVITGVTGGWS